jgi:hypothetical protein
VSIEELPAPPPRRWWIQAVASLLAVAALVGFLWARRRRRSPMSRSPLDDALHELGKLERMRLPERGKIEEFHTLLANVVRRFLEKEHGLSAPRRTTSEFVQELDAAARLSADQKRFLGDFLQRCDLAKFACRQVPADEATALLDETRAFLQASAASAMAVPPLSGEPQATEPR